MSDPMSGLSPEDLRTLVSDCVAVVKPGDVLAVRLPSDINGSELHRANEYGHLIESKTGVKVTFIPGEEFAHTTVNLSITVNGTGDFPKIADEVRWQLAKHAACQSGASWPPTA